MMYSRVPFLEPRFHRRIGNSARDDYSVISFFTTEEVNGPQPRGRHPRDICAENCTRSRRDGVDFLH